MPNIINTGAAKSLAYYPVAGTDVDDVGAELTWDNTSKRLILQKNNSSTSDSALTINYAGTTNPQIYLNRSRGTYAAPAVLQNNDRFPQLTFLGRGTSAWRTGAYIVAKVNGTTIDNNSMPCDIVFGTNNGTAVGDRVIIDKTGTLKVNTISDFSGGTLTISATSLNLGGAGSITIGGGSSGQYLTKSSDGKLAWTTGGGGNPFDQNLNTTNDVSFKSVTTDSLVFSGTGPVAIDSDNDLNFTATGNITFNGSPLPTNLNSLTDVVITSPEADQVLRYNGTNWVNGTTGSGGSSLQGRTTKTGTTNSLNSNSDANIDITAFKGYALYKIQVSHPSWVRIYNSSAARTADQSRAQSTDPLPAAGVLAEVVTTSSNETLSFSPALMCYNNDSTVGSNTYVRIRNLSGSTANITVTLTLLQTEA